MDEKRLDDARLTEEGLAPPEAPEAPEAPGAPGGAGPARVLVIACGALAREILALIRLNGWEHVALTCLPAKLHNRPERIPEAVRKAIRDARARGWESIFIGYADCGTGGLLDRVCAEEGVERIAGPHCYAFFDGIAAFEAREAAGEIDAFYLTDFLARQFEALVWRGMGLDRHPELLPVIFGNYRRLIYLAQTDDPALEAKARAAAERLGLSFEKRPTGYGDLATFVARAAAEAR